MDPLCHTLVGAALGCTGLEKTTRYSRTTLIIAANLPDIDVVAHFMGGTASYAFRRGITHGLPALIVLPILLTLAVLGWDRLRNNRHPWREDGSPPVVARWVLILALIGVWSHPALDWLNTYGMRWLMPMVNEWYYGDTLFIMDWVVWLSLLAGVVAHYRGFNRMRAWFMRPANWSLGFLLAYIVFNFNLTGVAERSAWRALKDDPPLRLFASPVPLNPLRRELVIEYPNHYSFADYSWTGTPALSMRARIVAKGDAENLTRARSTQDGRWFLHWARFPYSTSQIRNGQLEVTVIDARYVADIDNQRLDGFAIFETTLPAKATN